MKVCNKCVLPEVYPGIEFDESGTCNVCRESAARRDGTNEETGAGPLHFKDEEELSGCLEKFRNSGRKYDVLVPLSGGVDSCNALITICKKFKLKALGFHNDHGYEDETATENVKKLCRKLDVDVLLVQQDLVFMKKLWKYINECSEKVNSCYVCGNILYLNALEIADNYKIPLVINGYSKGQATMTNDKDQGSLWLEKVIEVVKESGDKEFFDYFIDKYKILKKKEDYRDRQDLEQLDMRAGILVIPFYIFDFYKTDKEVLEAKIKEEFDWQPMKTSYPNRTTNCEMVWLNTYLDREKMGYSLYELEYAELIRKGDFTRRQALEDLEFNPPPGLVERLAREVGIDIEAAGKTSRKTEGVKNKTMDIDFEF